MRFGLRVCRQRARLNTKDAMLEFSLSPPAAKVRMHVDTAAAATAY
jgi:hypothetical protein